VKKLHVGRDSSQHFQKLSEVDIDELIGQFLAIPTIAMLEMIGQKVGQLTSCGRPNNAGIESNKGLTAFSKGSWSDLGVCCWLRHNTLCEESKEDGKDGYFHGELLQLS